MDHLSNDILEVKIVERLLYLLSINWKNNLASNGLISLNPTSSIINNLYLAMSHQMADLVQVIV